MIRTCINCSSTLEPLMADEAPPCVAPTIEAASNATTVPGVVDERILAAEGPIPLAQEEILPNERYEDGWQVYVEQQINNVDNLESLPQDVLNWLTQATFNIIPTDIIQEIDKILDENPQSWEQKVHLYLQRIGRVEQSTNLGLKVVVENEPPFILHPAQLSSMNADN